MHLELLGREADETEHCQESGRCTHVNAHLDLTEPDQDPRHSIVIQGGSHAQATRDLSSTKTKMQRAS